MKRRFELFWRKINFQNTFLLKWARKIIEQVKSDNLLNAPSNQNNIPNNEKPNLKYENI